MKKMKTISITILILVSLILISRSNVKAVTYEGTTGTNAGGPTIYTKWFEDFTGVLIVSSTFANGSGAEHVDTTVFASSTEPTRAFKLRVWDSDEDQYVNPENEDGMGTCERRFRLTVHMDTKELTWKAMVTDETGLVVFAEIVLYFIYDEGAVPPPVIPDDDLIDKKERRKLQIRSWAWLGQALAGAFVGLFVGIKLTNRIYGTG